MLRDVQLGGELADRQESAGLLGHSAIFYRASKARQSLERSPVK
jgi:hypothetical protein